MPSLESASGSSLAAGSGISRATSLDSPIADVPKPPLNLRTFIDLLSREGCLKRISHTVDWKFEVGDITRTTEGPLLFENIKDYPGLRLFTNGLRSPSSMAVALGFHPSQAWNSVIREIRWKAAAPLAPIVLESGPVLENVVEGEDIDFLKFPIPHWSRYDAGRYIGTWHINVTRDPETGSRNLGVYRMQVVGRNQATVSTYANSHLTLHFAKAEKKGQPLEMAVVIGAAEPLIIAAAAAYPGGSDEYNLAGALEGEAVRLIRCKTVDLEVPAESEIVIEGVIKPGVRVQDGPFFDYAGKPTTNPNAFLFEATRLSFRNDPIFRGTAIGHPAAEDQQLFWLLAELGLFDFHSSRPKHWVQSALIHRRLFRAFQTVGRATMPPFLSRTLKRFAHQASSRESEKKSFTTSLSCVEHRVVASPESDSHALQASTSMD